MVERILAAGRAVLVDDGYDAFTTNRVATRAAISPGSLYQYFADKQAIIEAVTDRWADDVSERVTASLVDRLGRRGPAAVHGVLDALLAALEADPEVLRVVMTELPASRFRERRSALRRRITDVTAATLAAQPGIDPLTRAWVLVGAVEALATQWVLEPPPARGVEEQADLRARVLAEMTTLAVAYLAAPTLDLRAGAGSDAAVENR